MKKWNKKIYIFFSLFFVFSLFLFSSFSVLADSSDSQKEPYKPNDLELQCYYYSPNESTKYDHAEKTCYYYGSNGSIVVGWLQNDSNGKPLVYVSSVGNLAVPESEYVCRKEAVNHYDSDDKYVITWVHTYDGAYYERQPFSYDFLVSGDVHMKIFASRDSAVRFAKTGDESGLISDSSGLTDSNSVYAPDIGYLQNVKFNSRNVGADNSDLDNMTYYFSYDSVTNTGFDINQDGVRVSFYSTYKGIYYDSWAKYFKKDGNVKRFDNKILQVSANGSDRLEFSYEACMQSHASEKAETEALCDSSVPTFGQIEYWLRIEQKQSDGTWRYGGWVNCSNQSTSVQGDSIADDCITQTYDGNGNLDVDGGYGSGNSTPHTYGEGSTMDSADADAIENENHKRAFESIEDFGDGLELMKVQLGNIPKVIAEVFLALPSALIVAITSGFFVCIVLRILGR